MPFVYIYRMILVTGGTGLVGAHLLAKLTATETVVRALFRTADKQAITKKIFSYYYKSETSTYFSKIEWVCADITDIPATTEAFKGITNVYHCAGYISFESSEEEVLRKINVEGTANIVNLCLSFQIKKLCHVSSMATLGKIAFGKLISEKNDFDQYKNHSKYSVTKFDGEMEVWRGSQEGLAVVIVNPAIIIGPGIWDSGSGLLFQRIWNGLSFHFPKVTGFVAVEDVTSIMIKLMNSTVKNERFLLVAENVDFKKILTSIAISLKKTPPSHALKPWMLSLGWVIQTVGKKLFGTKKQISRNANKELFETSLYDSSKIKNELHVEFLPIEKAIENTAQKFLIENNV